MGLFDFLILLEEKFYKLGQRLKRRKWKQNVGMQEQFAESFK